MKIGERQCLLFLSIPLSTIHLTFETPLNTSPLSISPFNSTPTTMHVFRTLQTHGGLGTRDRALHALCVDHPTTPCDAQGLKIWFRDATFQFFTPIAAFCSTEVS